MVMKMFESFNILFYKGDSILGRLIKYVTKGKYSHCVFLLDQFHCLETSWNNPSVIKHFDYRYKDYDIYRLNVELNENQKQLILKYITEHIEVGYDFIFLISRLFHIVFGTKILNSKRTVTCDELIYDAFKNAGIQLIKQDEMLTPSTLANSEFLEIKGL
jgi:hypothetical protein